MRGVPLKEADFVGKRFGRLVVLGFSHRGPRSNGYWRFKCDCGNDHVSALHHVAGGKTLSCGCLNRELSKRRTTSATHNQSLSKEYNVWQAMLNRCRNKNTKVYKNYGGRGIFVCERWKVFENFYADMGPRPFTTASLERIDNDGPYSPENVIWVPKKEQAKNRQNTILVEVGGRSMCLSDAARLYGKPVATVFARVSVLGWPIQKALEQEVRPRSGKDRSQQ